jgi:ABC-type Fe3+-siderophore transport system permease subunit
MKKDIMRNLVFYFENESNLINLSCIIGGLLTLILIYFISKDLKSHHCLVQMGISFAVIFIFLIYQILKVIREIIGYFRQKQVKRWMKEK